MILRCDRISTETFLLYKIYSYKTIVGVLSCWSGQCPPRWQCGVCTVDDIKTKGDGWRMVAVANTDKEERELLLLPAQSKQH